MNLRIVTTGPASAWQALAERHAERVASLARRGWHVTDEAGGEVEDGEACCMTRLVKDAHEIRKRCNLCDGLKTLAEYPKSLAYADGRSPRCRACTKRRARERDRAQLGSGRLKGYVPRERPPREAV